TVRGAGTEPGRGASHVSARAYRRRRVMRRGCTPSTEAARQPEPNPVPVEEDPVGEQPLLRSADPPGPTSEGRTMHHENDPSASTWRDQLIELDLPGVGAITACADPALFADEPEGPTVSP